MSVDLAPTKIEPFIPVYSRGKNKLLRYEIRHFDDGVGHLADLTIAIYLDKNNEEQEMVARVKWK